VVYTYLYIYIYGHSFPSRQKLPPRDSTFRFGFVCRFVFVYFWNSGTYYYSRLNAYHIIVKVYLAIWHVGNRYSTLKYVYLRIFVYYCTIWDRYLSYLVRINTPKYSIIMSYIYWLYILIYYISACVYLRQFVL